MRLVIEEAQEEGDPRVITVELSHRNLRTLFGKMEGGQSAPKLQIVVPKPRPRDTVLQVVVVPDEEHYAPRPQES